MRKKGCGKPINRFDYFDCDENHKNRFNVLLTNVNIEIVKQTEFFPKKKEIY